MGGSKNSFAGGAVVYLISNILNATIPFALLPILTRLLSPEEYGEVAIFQTLLGAFGAFVGMVFVGAANRKYYDEHVDQKDLAEFVGTCVQLSLFSLTIVFLSAYVFKTQLSVWLGIEPQNLLFVIISSFCIVIFNLRLGQWQVKKEAAKYGIFQISKSLCDFFLSLIIVVAFLKGSQGRIDVQFLVSVIFLVASLFYLRRDGLLEIFVWKKKYHIEALRFGIPLMPHVAGGFLLTSADRIVINQEVGLAQTGIYMVAVQLTAVLGLVFDAVNKAYVPWLFERLKTGIYVEKQRIVKLTYLWFLMIILGVILAFFIGPWVVVFIAGIEYKEAGDVFGILALGQAFQGMYLMVTNYIFFSKRTGLLSFASIGSGVLNLVLLITLIPVLGLHGAAVAFATSMAIRFVLTWWIAQKSYPMPWFTFINR